MFIYQNGIYTNVKTIRQNDEQTAVLVQAGTT